MKYVFHNTKTGGLVEAEGYSLNSAARKIGINVPVQGKLPKPVLVWECWDEAKCIWHVTEDGKIEPGPRPVDPSTAG